jgi:hypothetical protein
MKQGENAALEDEKSRVVTSGKCKSRVQCQNDVIVARWVVENCGLNGPEGADSRTAYASTGSFADSRPFSLKKVRTISIHPKYFDLYRSRSACPICGCTTAHHVEILNVQSGIYTSTPV